MANFKIEPNMLDNGHFDVWRIKGNPDVGLLNPQDLERFQAMRDTGARRSFLLSRCAINCLARKYTNSNSGGFSISLHPGGKPFFVDVPDLHFSLSHTESEVALVFSRSPVGFDMEKAGRRTDFLAVAKRFFTSDEVLSIEAAGASAATCFLELWTAKEAVLKLEGTGISSGLERARILSETEADLDDRRVFLHSLEWPGLVAKLASFEKPVEVRSREL
ncbi:MAG: 4'-phosphopantetheinyl transferase family protein, partial [Spartobacteria bacterium]